jgi:hypothetical protein
MWIDISNKDDGKEWEKDGFDERNSKGKRKTLLNYNE